MSRLHIHIKILGKNVWLLAEFESMYFFQVKRENLSVVCDCAGDFSLMVPVTEIKDQLMTFKTIAEYYQMPLLLEQIDFNLKNM